LNSISNAADSPINMPPMVEATGVNGVMTAMEPCYAVQQPSSNIRPQPESRTGLKCAADARPDRAH
jgi:hypothetical protein